MEGINIIPDMDKSSGTFRPFMSLQGPINSTTRTVMQLNITDVMAWIPATTFCISRSSDLYVMFLSTSYKIQFLDFY